MKKGNPELNINPRERKPVPGITSCRNVAKNSSYRYTQGKTIIKGRIK